MPRIGARPDGACLGAGGDAAAQLEEATARAAQVGFVKAAGLEAARHNVQINLIAQNYVENPDYYPPELVETERFQRHLARNVPAGRLATGLEDAQLALFLASDQSDFIVGQAIPFSGGWTLNG